MPETSTAEEEELKESLDKGADVVTKLVGMVVDTVGEEINTIDLLEYFNEKILKLDDFDIRSFLKSTDQGLGEAKKVYEEARRIQQERRRTYRKNVNSDFLAMMPKVGKNGTRESKVAGSALNEDWQKQYGNIKVLSEKEAAKETKKEKRRAKS